MTKPDHSDEPQTSPEDKTRAEERAEQIATNLLVSDIAVFGGALLGQMLVRQGLKNTRFDPETTHEAAQSLPKPQGRLALVLSRLAKASVPTAAIIGSGVLGKALLDRSQTRRKTQTLRKTLRQTANFPPTDKTGT